MRSRTNAYALVPVLSLLAPLTAHAAPADDAAQQELRALRAQMEQMAQRIEALEGQIGAARTTAEGAHAASLAAQAAVQASAKPATTISWDGAPKITGPDGWSFKPRGRLQIDAGGVDAPDTVNTAQLGFAAEFRRMYIGFDGTVPGGFSYRLEADLAGNNVNLTDVYLSYKISPKVSVAVGQVKPFWGLEEMTSDLFTSFNERAAFTSAFGFERRLGVGASYAGKELLVQAGVFTDNAADLTDSNDSYSFDGRVVFSPKLGDSILHLGASFHDRDFNGAGTTTRYRTRPFVHTTDVRLVDTRAITATGERSYGAELAFIHDRLHATAESHWITPRRPGLADPTFTGGYAEVGYLLTDDTTAYKAGVYDRIRPARPFGKGGMGALQLNLRYDWLDLNDKNVVGGTQDIAGLSLLWMPTDYVRFILNYGHLWIDDAAVAAGASRSYEADAIGLRGQIDF